MVRLYPTAGRNARWSPLGRNRKCRSLRDLVRVTSAPGSECRLLEKGPTTAALDPKGTWDDAFPGARILGASL